MTTKIIFRTDAGANIGYGHFIRSLALANMLKNDFDISFATVDPTEYQKEQILCIGTLYSLNKDTHFEDFIEYLQGNEIVVLDNYFFTTDYQKTIKNKGTKLVCIDDMHDKHYVADLIINQGITSKNIFSVEQYTQFCLGIDWLLLRPPFIDAYKKHKNKENIQSINNIVVGFGGADLYNLTKRTIHVLTEIKNIRSIDVIIGDMFQRKEIPSSEKVKLHQNISAEEIAYLFSNCDLAILPTSTICLEALSCNARIATGFYVDNQECFYHYLEKEKIAHCLGNFLSPSYEEKLKTLLTSEALPKLNPFPANLSDLKERYINIFKKIYFDDKN